MITSRIARMVSLLCALVLFIGIGACATAEQAVPVPTPGATLVMIPTSALPGASVNFYGSGFQEGEEIDLQIVNANMTGIGIIDVHTGPKPEAVVANASGAWSSEGWAKSELEGEKSVIMSGIVPGVYTLRATGNKGTVATCPYIVLKAKTSSK